MGLIGSIVLGCLAGFCAGKLMKGGGLGFIMNLVLGLFGGLVGGWLFEQLGITWGGILGQLGTGWHTGTTGYSHHRCRCYSLGSLADQEIRNPK